MKYLEIGEQFATVLTMEPTRVVASHPEIGEVSLLGRRLSVLAKKPGRMRISYWFSDTRSQSIDVVVTPPDRPILERFLEVFLNDGSDVVRLDEPEKIWLSGVLNEEEYSHIQGLADTFQNLDISQLRQRPTEPNMIRFEVRVAEVKTNYLSKIGIDWDDALSGPGASLLGKLDSEGTSSGLLSFDWSFNLSSVLNLMEQRGEAELLASPTLKALEDQWSEFHAGGEIPIPAASNDGNPHIEFHPYGVKLRAKASSVSPEALTVSIDSEMSNLDPSVAIDGVPGLLTRRTQTQVRVRPGETIVIAGMKSSESYRSEDSTPFHALDNWLGSSRHKGTNRTELVVFLRPLLVKEERARNYAIRQFQRDVLSQLYEAKCKLD